MHETILIYFSTLKSKEYYDKIEEFFEEIFTIDDNFIVVDILKTNLHIVFEKCKDTGIEVVLQND